jgi:hypothetical protein
MGARSVRAQEQEIARLEARLTSLEELQAARAGFGDAPRRLAQANGRSTSKGRLPTIWKSTPAMNWPSKRTWATFCST